MHYPKELGLWEISEMAIFHFFSIHSKLYLGIVFTTCTNQYFLFEMYRLHKYTQKAGENILPKPKSKVRQSQWNEIGKIPGLMNEMLIKCAVESIL